MEKLPLELIRLVYNYLSPADRLNCLFVSRQFLSAAIIKDLPSSKILRFRLGSCPSQGHFSPNETCISICNCGRHGAVEVLKQFLPHFISDVHSLEVDDELAKSQVSDESLFALLSECANAPLNRLLMSNCNLAEVRPWTLALLASFNRLNEIYLDNCIFPLSESQLISSITPSFETLTSIEIRDNQLITDKFARRLSKCCSNLETYNVPGCSVTSVTVIAFVETVLLRSKPILNMLLDNTDFDIYTLAKCLRSPLFPAKNAWRIREAYLPLLYKVKAIILENIEHRCIIIRAQNLL